MHVRRDELLARADFNQQECLLQRFWIEESTPWHSIVAAFEQLRALSGRQAQPVRSRDVHVIERHRPLEHGQLANGGVDGSASVKQGNARRVRLADVAGEL
eukprot:838335-Prymnesium_polylepis.1